MPFEIPHKLKEHVRYISVGSVDIWSAVLRIWRGRTEPAWLNFRESYLTEIANEDVSWRWTLNLCTHRPGESWWETINWGPCRSNCSHISIQTNIAGNWVDRDFACFFFSSFYYYYSLTSIVPNWYLPYLLIVVGEIVGSEPNRTTACHPMATLCYYMRKHKSSLKCL